MEYCQRRGKYITRDIYKFAPRFIDAANLLVFRLHRGRKVLAEFLFLARSGIYARYMCVHAAEVTLYSRTPEFGTSSSKFPLHLGTKWARAESWNNEIADKDVRNLSNVVLAKRKRMGRLV